MSRTGAIGDSIVTQSALRSTLKRVIDELAPDKKEVLLDLISEDIASLERLWGTPLESVFKRDYVDELKRIQFMFRESKKLSSGHQTRREERILFCIDCDLPIINAGTDLVCPACGGDKWLDLTRI